MRRLLSELARFGAVGIAATLTHGGVYLLALGLLAPQIANLAGFLVAVSLSYFGHRYFSFREAGAKASQASAMARFGAVALLGLALNAGFVQLAEQVFEAPRLAFWCIVFVTPGVTFILLKFWVFGRGRS